MLSAKELMSLAIEKGASDLHLNPGRPPVGRMSGKLTSLIEETLDEDASEVLARELCNDSQWEELNTVGSTDFGIAHGDGNRFRASVFRQRGRYSAVLRLIPSELLSFEQIGIPEAVQELLNKPRGLILVTGPTGSGKTTTLASMVNVINQERKCHILTCEDPIEYYHAHNKSIVTQREIGSDVPTFSEALKRALRQDPDVILVGEMRDLETMEAAITAAETGHLVFATLHTTGAARTVDRIVDAFPTIQQAQIRTQLASGIVAVVSQLLLARADAKGGRVAAFEIMITTPSIQALIRDNKTFRISSDIQTGAKFGMISLDTHLMALYQAGQISYEDLITKAQEPDGVIQKLQETLGR